MYCTTVDSSAFAESLSLVNSPPDFSQSGALLLLVLHAQFLGELGKLVLLQLVVRLVLGRLIQHLVVRAVIGRHVLRNHA